MAMKIYQIYHTLQTNSVFATPDHDKFYAEIMGNLTSLPRDAPIPPFQLGDPNRKTQGFFCMDNSVLVFTREIYLSPLGASLDYAGNVHTTTLNDTGEKVFFLNVTAHYNCIDRSRTVYVAPQDRESIGVDHGLGIKRPAFFPKLIGGSWIFKLPQMLYAIFVASDGRGNEEDFYTQYMQSGMQELRFEQVWSEGD